MTAIVAMTPSRVIGAHGTIPWHLPEDLRFFKRTTSGHIVVMGRKTFASIGRPLPARENWVVSANADIPGTRMFRTPAAVAVENDRRKSHGDKRELFVIGGARIYEALLPHCSRLIVTRLNQEISGDTLFPEFEPSFHPVELLMETNEFRIESWEATRPPIP